MREAVHPNRTATDHIYHGDGFDSLDSIHSSTSFAASHTDRYWAGKSAETDTIPAHNHSSLLAPKRHELPE